MVSNEMQAELRQLAAGYHWDAKTLSQFGPVVFTTFVVIYQFDGVANQEIEYVIRGCAANVYIGFCRGWRNPRDMLTIEVGIKGK